MTIRIAAITILLACTAADAQQQFTVNVIDGWGGGCYAMKQLTPKTPHPKTCALRPRHPEPRSGEGPLQIDYVVIHLPSETGLALALALARLSPTDASSTCVLTPPNARSAL